MDSPKGETPSHKMLLNYNVYTSSNNQTWETHKWKTQVINKRYREYSLNVKWRI
jgi:hypothetical protein